MILVFARFFEHTNWLLCKKDSPRNSEKALLKKSNSSTVLKEKDIKFETTSENSKSTKSRIPVISETIANTTKRDLFQKRKSQSLMELPRVNKIIHSSPVPWNGKIVKPLSNETTFYQEGDHIFQQKSFEIRDQFCGFIDPEIADPRLAGLKIYASILLNAWRERRAEVKKLSAEIKRINKNYVHQKNQVHVLRTMFQVEQRRNDDLNSRIRDLLDKELKTKNLNFELNSSLAEIRSEKSTVEKNLQEQTDDYLSLRSEIDLKANELNDAFKEIDDLRNLMKIQKNQIRELKSDKNELLNKLDQRNFEATERQVVFEALLAEKSGEIDRCMSQLDKLEKKLNEVKGKEAQFKELEALNGTQRATIEDLTAEVARLEKQIESTIKYRLKAVWEVMPRYTMQCLHVAMFLLLPAVPPPIIGSRARKSKSIENKC